MVVRTLFLSAVVATLGYADTFSSYCTIIQGGVVTASNNFSTLLPEGPGAACPDVDFFGNALGDVSDYTHFIFSAAVIDPEPLEPYGAVWVGRLHISIGAYAQIPPELVVPFGSTVFFGQTLEMSKTQTFTIAQPTATSARFATLPELHPFVEWSDSNFGLDGIDSRPGGFNSLSTQIITPRVIEYGVPFDVTAIVRLSGDWQAYDFGQRSIFSYQDLSAFGALTPVPEPSGFLSASQRSARRLTCIENPAGEDTGNSLKVKGAFEAFEDYCES